MERRSQISRISELCRHAVASDGMTMVELVVAALILAVGILSTFAVLEASGHSTHVSEILEAQNHLAQQELERIESLPYKQIALTSGPGTSANTLNPLYYVSGSGCANFTWNQTAGAMQSDPLVINGCSGVTGTPGTVNPVAAISTPSPGYTLYDFVTWVPDSTCGGSGTCNSTTSYKRVTVEVTANQVARLTPTSPVLVSAIVGDPSAAPSGVTLNTNSPLVTCDPIVPSTTPCNYGLDGQTANIFYLTDSPEQSAVQTVGQTTNGSTAVTSVANTSGVQVGMKIAGPAIASGTTVAGVSGSSLTLSQNATATASASPIAIGPTSGVQTTGNVTAGSNVISSMGSTLGDQPPVSGKTLGMYVSDSKGYLPTGTTVSSVDSSSQIHISQNATTSGTGDVISVGPYQPRAADNSCMHYGAQSRPLSADGSVNCGGASSSYSCAANVTASTTPNACAQPDLLFPAPPPTTIGQEYNFSPNLSNATAGRVIKRDPSSSVTSCSVAPSNNATSSQLWATQPLASALNLTGFGGMSLYSSTLSGVAQNVTVCFGIYLITPVSTSIGSFLDPLSQLAGNDSTSLGTVAYTTSWPAAMTPLSFTFNYMSPDGSKACSGVTSSTYCAPAGSSIGLRMWVTNNSGDDIVVNYDSPSVPTAVEIDSQ